MYSSPLATTFLGKSEADCVERMRRFAEHRPTGWLLAQGWREYRWDPPVAPTKRSLDAAFPARAVALYSGDAHTLWLNSVALRELGHSRESEPPAGGSYDRFEDGELTGIVREAAAMELMPKIMGTFTDAEVADAYRGFLAELARNGVTSVCDMSLMAHPGLDFIRDDMHATLLAWGELTARVHLFPTLLADMGRFEAMRKAYTGPMLQAPGFKQFFDGVSSQHTAWVTEPYANARFAGDRGRPTVDAKTMRALVLSAAAKGHPVRIHTIGDAAIHAALDIFEEARATYGPLPAGRHNCLEHLENFCRRTWSASQRLTWWRPCSAAHDARPRRSRARFGARARPPHVALPHASGRRRHASVRNGLAGDERELYGRAVQRRNPAGPGHARAAGGGFPPNASAWPRPCAPTPRAAPPRSGARTSWERSRRACWPMWRCLTATCSRARPKTCRRRGY